MQIKYRFLRNWCSFTFSLEQLWKLFSLKNLFSSFPFQLILIDNDIKTVYLLICQAFLERTCTFMSRRIIFHMFFFFCNKPFFQAILLLFSLRQVCRTKHVKLSSTCFVFFIPDLLMYHNYVASNFSPGFQTISRHQSKPKRSLTQSESQSFFSLVTLTCVLF